VRVLRRNGSALRSERHLHQPEDLHGRGRLQQLSLRRHARRYLEVDRIDAKHHYDDDDDDDDHHTDTNDDDDHHTYDDESSAQ
jgi:hypothetical protein